MNIRLIKYTGLFLLLLLSFSGLSQERIPIINLSEVDGKPVYLLLTGEEKPFVTPTVSNTTPPPVSTTVAVPVSTTVTAATPNVIVCMTPTVAGLQTAINSATAVGTTVLCGFASCVFGDAENLQINDKHWFILDLNKSHLQASSSRTMFYLNGNSDNIRICNGRISNLSPTLPYNSKYGYFASITTNEDAIINGLEIDHCEMTSPNSDQDFILFVTYRDVDQSNHGGTSVLRRVNIHHNNIHDVGRMACEFINGGAKYGDFTKRYFDCSFNDNACRSLGLISPEGYGMAVSWDGLHQSCTTSRNFIRNAKGIGIEIVGGESDLVDGNTIVDDNGSSGCVGISLTNNGLFENPTLGIGPRTRNNVVIGNVTDVYKRAIQAYQNERLILSGNLFKSVKGSDFILKQSTITGNRFWATQPDEPVVSFHPSGDNGKFWCSMYNVFNSNTVTNAGGTKPNGYGGPYELIKWSGGSNYNTQVGNILLMDPAVNTGSFPYVVFVSGESVDQATFQIANNLQTTLAQPGFANP